MAEGGRREAMAALAIAAVAISFSSIFVRWCESPPLVIAAWRMLLAALILTPLAFFYRPQQFLRLTRRDLAIMAGLGVVLGLHFFAFIASLSYTSVAASTLLICVHPLIVGVVSILVFKEAKRWIAVGIALGFMGILLLTVGSLGTTSDFGNMLALIAGVLIAIYIMAGRLLMRHIGLLAYCLVIYLFAAIFLFALCFATAAPVWPLPGDDLLLIFIMAAVCSNLGQTLYNRGLQDLAASTVSTVLIAEPIISTILAVLLLGEAPPAGVLLAGIFILIGVVIVLRGEKRTERPKAQ
jgi:drug/metabolite transporter (DMT)-like permease